MLKGNEQQFYLQLGRYGCYFLCLVHIAEKYTDSSIDVYNAAMIAKDNGAILLSLDFDDADDFFINDPEKILALLTGTRPKVRHSSSKEAAVQCAEKEKGFVITKYIRGNVTHFDMETFHPLYSSYTKKYGEIEGYRLVQFD